MIQGKEYFYDDLDNKGGLTIGSKFIMMGDQNLDPIAGKYSALKSKMASFIEIFFEIKSSHNEQ